MVPIEDVNDKIDKLIEAVKMNPHLNYSPAKVVYMLERLKEVIVKGAL